MSYPVFRARHNRSVSSVLRPPLHQEGGIFFSVKIQANGRWAGVAGPGFFGRPVSGTGKKNLQTLDGFPADDDEREETADDVILEFDFENSTSAEALQL